MFEDVLLYLTAPTIDSAIALESLVSMLYPRCARSTMSFCEEIAKLREPALALETF